MAGTPFCGAHQYLLERPVVVDLEWAEQALFGARPMSGV